MGHLPKAEAEGRELSLWLILHRIKLTREGFYSISKVDRSVFGFNTRATADLDS